MITASDGLPIPLTIEGRGSNPPADGRHQVSSHDPREGDSLELLYLHPTSFFLNNNSVTFMVKTKHITLECEQCYMCVISKPLLVLAILLNF